MINMCKKCSEAWEACKKATLSALEAYDKAIAPAYEACKKATVSASEAYEKVRAKCEDD